VAAETILLHADVLLDRRAVGRLLPDAWAPLLYERYGGTLGGWRSATAQVAGDWNSYWADLDLSGDDSLNQWREGRWRIVRAWFRLAGQPVPDVSCMTLFLDRMPREVGCQIDSGWRTHAIDTLGALAAAGIRTGVVDPFSPASLLHGMLNAAGVDPTPVVIGPDELCQVGLEEISWSWMVRLAGGSPQRTCFVSQKEVDGWSVISPPADLRFLPDLVHGA
jgi:hypothetical protein